MSEDNFCIWTPKKSALFKNSINCPQCGKLVKWNVERK